MMNLDIITVLILLQSLLLDRYDIELIQQILMGNNYDKYFGNDKRKILVVGIENSGKTSLIHTATTGEVNSSITSTKDLNIKDWNFGKLTITFFDLAGGERQRIFWKQHFQGTQGVIYTISLKSDNESLNYSLTQLQKILKVNCLISVPFAVALTKSDSANELQVQRIKSQVQKITKLHKQSIQIFMTSFLNRQSMTRLLKWLLEQTVPV